MTIQTFFETRDRILKSAAPLLVCHSSGKGDTVKFDSCPAKTVFADNKINSNSQDVLGVYFGLQGAEAFTIAARKYQ